MSGSDKPKDLEVRVADKIGTKDKVVAAEEYFNAVGLLYVGPDGQARVVACKLLKGPRQLSLVTGINLDYKGAQSQIKVTEIGESKAN